MAEIKTQPTDGSVEDLLESIDNEKRQRDAWTLLEIFKRITGKEAVMWGDSIVGFGSYSYSNTRGTYSWPMTGFSPRKQNSTLYVMQGFQNFQDDLVRLGKVKTSKSCLYINDLTKLDRSELENLLTKVVADMAERYECT